MKRLIPLFVILTMILSSCGLYDMITYPKEIKDIGGDIQREITAFDYEVKVGDEIVRKQDNTQSYLYLYRLDGNYYWKIRRSPIETKNSFFPENLDIKVDNYKKLDSGSSAFYGVDELTGKRYTIAQIPWSKGGGYFYILGDSERQIVYSVEIIHISVY